MRKIKIIPFVTIVACCCLLHSAVNAQAVRHQKADRQRNANSPAAANQRAKYQQVVDKSKKVFEENERKSNGNRASAQRPIANKPVMPVANRTSTNQRQSYQQLVQSLKERNQSTTTPQANRSLARTNNMNISQKKTYSYYVQKAEAEKRQTEMDRMNKTQ